MLIVFWGLDGPSLRAYYRVMDEFPPTGYATEALFRMERSPDFRWHGHEFEALLRYDEIPLVYGPALFLDSVPSSVSMDMSETRSSSEGPASFDEVAAEVYRLLRAYEEGGSEFKIRKVGRNPLCLAVLRG